MFSQKKRNLTWIYVCIVLLQSGPDADNSTDVQDQDQNDDDQDKFYQSYYLVKYDNNVIKIYFSDETGKLTELESTSIVYETLSQGDQAKFREGIKVENRDDLNRLMMDYES